MQAACAVRGLHRQEISEFFQEQADSEAKHIQEFRHLLHGLCTKRGFSMMDSKVPDLSIVNRDPMNLLFQALKLEDEVVSNYVERISQASKMQELGGEDAIDGKYIELFLEDQILDSRGDADNIREMLFDYSDGKELKYNG